MQYDHSFWYEITHSVISQSNMASFLLIWYADQYEVFLHSPSVY